MGADQRIRSSRQLSSCYYRREKARGQLSGAAGVRLGAAAWVIERPGARRLRIPVIGRHGDLGAVAPTSDRVRPGRGSSASGGLAGARLHGIASLQLMSSATRQVVCLQDFALSKRLEHAELRGCYRVRPDLPTSCGSPDKSSVTGDDHAGFCGSGG